MDDENEKKERPFIHMISHNDLKRHSSNLVSNGAQGWLNFRSYALP